MERYFERTLSDLATIKLLTTQVLKPNNFIPLVFKDQTEIRDDNAFVGKWKTYIVEAIKKIDQYPVLISSKLKIKSALKYLSLQLIKWVKINIIILRHDPTFFLQFVQWSSTGRIDVKKTVANISSSDDITTYSKILFNCKFCNEKEIVTLWGQLSNPSKLELVYNPDVTTKYWVHFLRNNRPSPVQPMDISMESEYVRLVHAAIQNENIQAFAYFWPKLLQGSKENLKADMYPLPEDILSFLLSRQELPEVHINTKFSGSILVSLVHNWLWRADFRGQFEARIPFLSKNDLSLLVEAFLEVVEEYSVTIGLQGSFETFWRVCGQDVLETLTMLIRFRADLLPINFLVIVDGLTRRTVETFLGNPKIILALIEQEKYELLDHLLSFKSEEEVTEFKLELVTQLFEPPLLQTLKQHNLKSFFKLKAWASPSDEAWEEFIENDSFSPENIILIFKNILIKNGVNAFLEFLENHLSPEEMTAFEQKIKSEAEQWFLWIVSKHANVFPRGIHKALANATEFLKYCFPSEDERKAFKKNIVSVHGSSICSEVLDYKDEIVEFFSSTPTVKVEFIRTLLDENLLDGMFRQLESARSIPFYDTIFEGGLFSQDEVIAAKRKMFLSSKVNEQFFLMIAMIGSTYTTTWENLKKLVVWFNPSAQDVEAFKAMRPEHFQICAESLEIFHKLLDTKELYYNF